MKKDIEYYMNLPYKIEIEPIEENEGGGFVACIPQLGRYAICGDGMTREEAIDQMRIIQRERFEEYLKKGLSIPEPEE